MSMIILYIPDVEGECMVETKDKKFEKMILCESLSHDMEVEMEVSTNARRTVHTPKVNNISIERKWDRASPKIISLLLRAAVQGTEPWKVHCLKSAGDSNHQWEEYLTMYLTNPMIAKHTLNVNEADTTESIEINATTIRWEYKAYKENQAPGGQSSVEFDLLRGKVA